MSVQRSEFTLEAGLNRPGPPPDPIDIFFPTPPRLLPKGADVAGVQVAITFDDIGNLIFATFIEGTNQRDPKNEMQPDPNASWIAASLPSLFFGDPLGPLGDLEPKMVNPLTQNVTLAPFLFVRGNIFLSDGDLDTASNLSVLFHFKMDYRTG